MLKQIGSFLLASLIERWLKAGYIYKNFFNQTDVGTPKSGIVSLLLANIALDGIESEIGIRYRVKKNDKRVQGFSIILDDYKPRTSLKIPGIPYGPASAEKLNITHNMAYIRYRDDFVILCESQEDAEAAKLKVAERLKVRGLELSAEKTRIRHITDGFDFLGVNIKLYECNINIPGKRGEKIRGHKLLIKPSPTSVKKLREKLDLIFKSSRGLSVVTLIDKINPVIRGWVNYHRLFVSRKVFESLDAYLYLKSMRYGLRTHPNKGKKWVKSKYFSNINKNKPEDKWVFGETTTGIFMYKFRWISITRHKMVPNGYSPDNPRLHKWWLNSTKLGVDSNLVLSTDAKIAQKQMHICPICFE